MSRLRGFAPTHEAEAKQTGAEQNQANGLRNGGGTIQDR